MIQNDCSSLILTKWAIYDTIWAIKRLGNTQMNNLTNSKEHTFPGLKSNMQCKVEIEKLKSTLHPYRIVLYTALILFFVFMILTIVFASTESSKEIESGYFNNNYNTYMRIKQIIQELSSAEFYAVLL